MRTRLESDALGNVEIANNHYWGTTTQRSINCFSIGSEKIPIAVIYAIALIKKHAAIINQKFDLIDPKLSSAIVNAADDIIKGKFDDQFPLRVWQAGSGTHTNMNVNEVIANIANEALGTQKGSKSPIHPNDHVNMGQSSNDTIPTAMNISVVLEVHKKLLPALELLYKSLNSHAEAWKNIKKPARTHMQDAVEMTLGQEFSGYATQIQYGIKRVKSGMKGLYYLAQGGTAVGTGLSTHKDFASEISREIAAVTGYPFKTADNKFEAIATNDALLQFCGSINTLAASLTKIAGDIKLLCSGPSYGIGEIVVPAQEPGSSMMPCKVNPTICEALLMVCAQVMGNHTAVTIGCAHGQLELSTFKPLVIYNILQSIELLSDAITSFTKYCVEGIKPSVESSKYLDDLSITNITKLASSIGYDKAAKISQYARQNSLSIREAAIRSGALSLEEMQKFQL